MENSNAQGLILVISGPAGSGKGTVVDLIMKSAPNDFALSVSATTRSPRPGEVDGKSYHFISRSDFESRIAAGQMLEYNYYCDNYYGTPADYAKAVIDSGKNLILEIDVNGGMQVKKSYPDAVLIMLLPPSIEVQRQRLVHRDTETPDVIERRVEKSKEELKFVSVYDYVVYNYDGRTLDCMEDILSIVRSEKSAVRHLKDVEKRYLENKN